MIEYIATFHTHLSALITSRNLTALGIRARMMPVPRKLSSSCGTCVQYFAQGPNFPAMDSDMEAVYEKTDHDGYTLLLSNE